MLSFLSILLSLGCSAMVEGGGGSSNTTGQTDSETETNSEDTTDIGYDERPIIVGSFPESGKAAAAKDVEISFAKPQSPGARFQCLTTRVAAPSGQWKLCDGANGTNLIARPNPGSNGLTRTEVRLLFSDNTPGNSISFEYYVHNSLANGFRCPNKASDSIYFKAAAEKLPHGKPFPAETKLRNPFISIPFDPPVSGTYGIKETDGLAEPLSLRRRFVLNQDRTMLLLTRTYASRRLGDNDHCEVGSVQTHNPMDTDPERFRNRCDAVVFNAHGAAACLYVDGNGAVQFRGNGVGFSIPPFNAAGVDHFLWRKMLANRHDWFSAKCFSSPTCNSGNPDIIYLPDHEIF
jgi:hypothetical protein